MRISQRSALFLIVAHLTAFGSAGTALGERYEIVVPSELVLDDDELLEGDEVIDMTNAGSHSRIQWVYPASDFPLAPTTRYVLTDILQRADATQNAPGGTVWTELRIELSATDVDVLSTHFDNNIIREPTLFFDGPHTWHTDNKVRPDGTKEFDLAMPFNQEPFVFDPSEHLNLLMDYRAVRDPGALLLDWHRTDMRLQTVMNLEDFDARNATIFSSATAVRKFIFYPIGDSNFDGQFDVDDIDLLTEAIGGEFRARFDIKEDGKLDESDLNELVHNQMNTWLGDANLDGEFNSGDLVQVFAAGLYETKKMAGWAQGDWNADMQFGSSDLVAAFTDSGYEQGPHAAVVNVPEPTVALLFTIGMCGLLVVRNRIRHTG